MMISESWLICYVIDDDDDDDYYVMMPDDLMPACLKLLGLSLIHFIKTTKN